MKRMTRGVCIILILLFTNTALAQEFIGKGAIIISHMSPDYDQAADEFIILYNATADTLDLNGYEIRYFTASGSSGSAGRSFLVTTTIPPFEHMLLASNDTVTVGVVTVVRDGPLSSGMAATGGQVVLRSSNLPDSIVYAAAWGSVSQYVAGMSDAASWTSDGMAVLLWRDSVYVRTSHIGSNAEYVHVSSDSITFLPSQAGGVLPAEDITWGIPVAAVQGGWSDSSVVIGLHEQATDGFDHLLDLPLPPPPAGTSLRAGIFRPDLGLATGDHLLHDVRELQPLADTTVQWFLDVWPAKTGTSLSVSLDLSFLPPYLSVELRDLASGDRVRRETAVVSYAFVPATTDPHRFLIVMGDTTPPQVYVQAPFSDTAVVVGADLTIAFTIDEPSGIDSLSAIFHDLSAESAYPVFDTTAPGGTISWQLPRRLLTDSSRFSLYVRDSMGNAATYPTPSVRVVPDTMRAEFGAGWHSFSVPLEPVGEGPISSGDSAYLFEYRADRGYVRVDSALPGKGYFIGLLGDRELTLSGIPAEDSLSVPLAAGFALVSHPGVAPIAVDDLVFTTDTAEYSHSAAITNAVIASGLYGYDHATGVYQSRDSLRPWESCWIPVLAPSVSVRFPNISGQGSARRRPHAPEGWQVRLTATFEGTTDSLFSFGVHPLASDGFDGRFDVPAPPSPPGDRTLRVYAERPDWEAKIGTIFLKDVRRTGSLNVWDFSVALPYSGTFVVRWGGATGDVPSGLEIREAGTGDWGVLDEEWTYSYTGAGTRRFEVRMTTTGADEPGEGIPGDFTVIQNYPNPFNPTTQIGFQIPDNRLVRVSVLDVLGRELTRLVDEVRPAGTYTVTWNAETFPSGVYLYRVTATGTGGSSSAVRRMVLLR